MSDFTIGVPKERKFKEGRVGMTPEGVKVVTACGPHVRVMVEKGAGILAGFSDKDSFVFFNIQQSAPCCN